MTRELPVYVNKLNPGDLVKIRPEKDELLSTLFWWEDLKKCYAKRSHAIPTFGGNLCWWGTQRNICAAGNMENLPICIVLDDSIKDGLNITDEANVEDFVPVLMGTIVQYINHNHLEKINV